MDGAEGLNVVGMDHIVLRTLDVERSLEFYTRSLGLPTERVDEWRRGEVPFPSVRLDATTIIDIFEGDGDGQNLDHLCLVIDPVDLAAVVDSGGLDVIEGPVTRWGARGDGTSIYVRDPDANIVELKHYG